VGKLIVISKNKEKLLNRKGVKFGHLTFLPLFKGKNCSNNSKNKKKIVEQMKIKPKSNLLPEG
jgi:hypothetical protein